MPTSSPKRVRLAWIPPFGPTAWQNFSAAWRALRLGCSPSRCLSWHHRAKRRHEGPCGGAMQISRVASCNCILRRFSPLRAASKPGASPARRTKVAPTLFITAIHQECGRCKSPTITAPRREPGLSALRAPGPRLNTLSAAFHGHARCRPQRTDHPCPLTEPKN